MFRISVNVRGQKDPLLGGTSENVTALSRTAVKPFWIIKGPTAQHQNVWKSLQIETYRRPATCTKIDCYAFLTGVRGMIIAPRGNTRKPYVVSPTRKAEPVSF
jgi:hypothetical protein